MATEIERKFLVNDRWRDLVMHDLREIRQGYLPTEDGVTVRVRVADWKGLIQAWLAVKGPTTGISRPEFEYAIPLVDASGLFALCGKRVIRKIRGCVPSRGNLVWEIDIFKDRHEGLVLAEIELDKPDRKVHLPKWIDREVSGDPRYSNHSLAIHGLKLVGKAA